MTHTANSDRIERSILLNAPRERVWHALSNAEEFGKWFGADLKGQTFAPGKRARGPITQPGYQHAFLDVLIDRIEPQHVLSFRWHPYSDDADTDYTAEQPTLVIFTLSDGPGSGTVLTVVESGFNALHGLRRMEAFGMNSRGWEEQLNNVSQYVDR